MNNFPFEEKPDEVVFICSHLLEENAELNTVYHFDTPVFAWSFLCDKEKHDKADIAETSLGKVFASYPEIAVLAETPPNVMMKKSKESGKWFGFAIKGR